MFEAGPEAELPAEEEIFEFESEDMPLPEPTTEQPAEEQESAAGTASSSDSVVILENPDIQPVQEQSHSDF